MRQDMHFSMHKYLHMSICVYRQTLISVYPSGFGKLLFYDLIFKDY